MYALWPVPRATTLSRAYLTFLEVSSLNTFLTTVDLFSFITVLFSGSFKLFTI